MLETSVEELMSGGHNILKSPDYFDEAEVLVEGSVRGLRVTKP